MKWLNQNIQFPVPKISSAKLYPRSIQKLNKTYEFGIESKSFEEVGKQEELDEEITKDQRDRLT